MKATFRAMGLVFGLGMGMAGWVSPAQAASDAAAAAPIEEMPRTLDDAFADVAELVPEFGGLYLDDHGKVHIVLLDPSPELLELSKGAIAAVFGPDQRLPFTLGSGGDDDDDDDGGQVHVERGRFGFLDLIAARERSLGVLNIAGVSLLDIDERENRLAIGVEHMSLRHQVEQQLQALGVSLQMVKIRQVPRIIPYPAPQTFLQEKVRPLIAGLQIEGSTTCTMGPIVKRLLVGFRGFLTNSHCTIQSTLGGVNSSSFWQPEVALADDVGTEIIDPLPFSGAACPSNRECRWSDSAFIQIDPGVTGRRGVIANPGNNGLGFPYSVHHQVDYPLGGEVLTKVGRTTAKTAGAVFQTCVHVNSTEPSYPSNLTLLCQDFSEADGGPGDSGSPVFHAPPNQISVYLYGVQWGGPPDGTYSVFSAMANLQFDVGTLLVEHENEPPDLEITAPQDGATVGSGTFVNVTFEASFFDFEDGDECDGCEVSWVSSVDGFMGVSTVVGGQATLQFILGSPGTRTIMATAVDSFGGTSMDFITITTSNSPPQVFITEPQDGATLFTGFLYVFQGESFDPEIFSALPCSSLQWTSSQPGDPIHNTAGCTLSTSFPSAGPRTITLTGTDADNATGTDTIGISVINPPANGPPVVTITNPPDGALLSPNQFTTLVGVAQDPDGQSPIAYQWILKQSGHPNVVLFSGNAQNGQNIIHAWMPADNVPFNCGGALVELELVATDPANDTGSDSIEITIAYPPC